jgi:solute carrier family 35, member F1/2
LFNYILLALIYTTYTVYRYGFKKYFKLLLVDGWKYAILSFFDVEGNYFTVLAYRYTNILSVNHPFSVQPTLSNHHRPNSSTSGP